MKRISLLFAMLMVLTALMGEDWISIRSVQPKPADVTVLSSNIENNVISFTMDGYFMQKVFTPNGPAYVVRVDEGSPLLEAGTPDVPKLIASLLIPDRARMEVEVVSASYVDYTDVEVAPSKGNLTRDIDPATVPYTYGPAYSQDQFYPGNLTEMRDPYIIRDYRGQTVVVYPVQYNPVQRLLRVYTDLTVRVKKVDDNGVNPLLRKEDLTKVDPDFRAIYARHFINYSATDYTPVDEIGCMLIISYGSFMTSMNPFVEWKRMMGREVEMVDVATIGTSSAIKTYIANYYNSHNLAYVLLVGDAAQVPTSYASGDSDNNYTYVVGSDHYPDLFIGRFSAENTSHVATQVQRTIEYEKTPVTTVDWFTKCIGIASSQGPGDDGEYDYQHVRNMQTDLLNYTYTYNYELFDGSQGGHDATGNPTAAQVAVPINSGSSNILYCGHGSNTSWSTSGFSNSNVASLTNQGKLPFIWAVACVNGNFKNYTCFAEAWLRSTSGGQPIGAIATLMSTINQSWNPPMEGQDEMVDILVESYASNIKRSFGGLSMNGCMKMNDTYGSGGWSMTDTWTCFGDPSVVVRTDVPTAISATHNGTIPLGATQFTINSSANGALACLTFNNQILGTGTISGGTVTITFPALTSLGTMKVTLTAYNKIPYLGEAAIIPSSPPPQVDIKIMLEGPYGAGQMNSYLNTFNFIPLSQPFTMAPYLYYGTESVTSIPNTNVVDWVLVEFRETSGSASAAVSATMIEREAAFVLKNGNIVGLDGTTPIELNTPTTQNVFLVVWHRNHLGVMSAVPLTLSGGNYSYDFTAASSAAHGAQNAQKDLGGNVWGMIAGDGDSNGQVSTTDKVEVWGVMAGQSGYKKGDYDMNGTVDNADKIEKWIPNSGRSCQVP